MAVKNNLNTLYREHAENIVRYLQRNYGAGPPEPEDVVQDVFARFGESRDPECIDNPKAYLYKMAVNQTLNGIDRVKRINRYISEQMSAGQEQMDEIDPERLITRQKQLASIGESLHLLSEKQRQILIRSRLKGQTYAQISAELGWSQADISRHLYAALSILQQASGYTNEAG
ncbi:RNA polymerase sigma factor [Lacimicrobium alkaliphilum]|uniref:RNA polymerase sigma factor n=1 Tax=Lacimicrobium alkaliphilum TaxID=1526571 RepID=UPI00166D46C9|nr:sigma-70 family RNA polymerase sigma factor [Lacimicrobium alkaliphilum]